MASNPRWLPTLALLVIITGLHKITPKPVVQPWAHEAPPGTQFVSLMKATLRGARAERTCDLSLWTLRSEATGTLIWPDGSSRSVPITEGQLVVRDPSDWRAAILELEDQRLSLGWSQAGECQWVGRPDLLSGISILGRDGTTLRVEGCGLTEITEISPPAELMLPEQSCELVVESDGWSGLYRVDVPKGTLQVIEPAVPTSVDPQ